MVILFLDFEKVMPIIVLGFLFYDATLMQFRYNHDAIPV